MSPEPSLSRVHAELYQADDNGAYRPESSDKSEPCGSIFKPVFSIVICSCLLYVGFWIMMIIAQRRGLRAFVIGVVCVVCGYVRAIFSGVFLSCHFSDGASASQGSFGISASCCGRAEDVRVVQIVIAKFEFRNIERQIFSADMVISPDDAPLDERPESLNRVRLNGADDVLAGRVIH
jgi:hypothetical protein